MDQMNLFAAEPTPALPAYRPDPEKLRSRLRRIIGQARAAEAAPWPATTLNLYRTIVPDMTRWLPDDEAADWRAQFEAELERLAPSSAA